MKCKCGSPAAFGFKADGKGKSIPYCLECFERDYPDNMDELKDAAAFALMYLDRKRAS